MRRVTRNDLPPRPPHHVALKLLLSFPKQSNDDRLDAGLCQMHARVGVVREAPRQRFVAAEGRHVLPNEVSVVFVRPAFVVPKCGGAHVHLLSEIELPARK
jgi:hypothetical protein